MEHARRLYLVDDFVRVYKQLQRPTAAVAKTRSSIQLTKTLDDKILDEDERVRQYIAKLHRYLNVGEPRPQTQQQQKRKPIGDKLLPLAPPPSLSPAGRRLRLRSAPKRTLQEDTDTDDDDVFVFTHGKNNTVKQKKTPKSKRRTKADDGDWAVYRRRK